MENNVNVNVEENVNNEPKEQVADVQQPMEGNVEGNGTPVEGKPEPVATKPTFKEKIIKGCKTVGDGCKTFAKAAKPYVVGAAGGIALAGITLYKVYKATHDTEGGECLSKTDTPLLDYNPEVDNNFDSGTVEDTGEGDTSVDATDFDVTDVEL